MESSSTTGDPVRLGVIGLGNRGGHWVRDLAGRDDVEIAYLCDVDARKFAPALETVDSAGRASPKTVQDLRRVLDDPDVDAIVVATNHQWHALATILACQAGKDVYVEKPGSHNAWEGRQMVAAARKYDRVVQVGLQNRSAPYLRTARDYVRSGALGTLHAVRVLNMDEGALRPRGPEQPVPAALDWEMWCGPGPLVPYSPGTWPINRFDFSTGLIADGGTHQLDVMRLVTDLDVPESVVHAGGVRHFHDGRDVPDTQMATYEFPGGPILVFQATLWAHYVRETPSVVRDGDRFPDWLFNATLIELFGSEGMMLVGRMGGGWQAFDLDGKMVESSYGRQAAAEHMSDFLSCVRSRERPNADIEESQKSTLLVHLANVSYRVGNRKLAYDAESGHIRDDPEADALMKREGRAPWRIPDPV